MWHTHVRTHTRTYQVSDSATVGRCHAVCARDGWLLLLLTQSLEVAAGGDLRWGRRNGALEATMYYKSSTNCTVYSLTHVPGVSCSVDIGTPKASETMT